MSTSNTTTSTSSKALKDVDGNSDVLVAPTEKKANANSTAARNSTKKAITLKELSPKLKNASKMELMNLLQGIFSTNDAAWTVLDTFTPDFPTKDDPVLCQCFHCQASNCGLLAFYDVMACPECYDLVACAKRLTRKKVMSVFGFTQPQADQIPGRRHDNSGYHYNLDQVVRAVQQRDGSLFHFVARTHHGRSTTPTVGARVRQQTTPTAKLAVLHHALAASQESSLQRLLQQVVQAVPELQLGGILDAFVPAVMTTSA